MTFKKHITTLVITFIIWLIFLVAGLPTDYYQTLSFMGKVWLSVFAFILILPIAYAILKIVWKESYVKSAVWCAFYASVPVAIYDFIYVGLMKGSGFSYLSSHWYLTIFYFIVWIEILPVGILMAKREND